MEKFIELTAIAAPLLRINIDTDAIIPSRELKRVSKKGLGTGLFAGWRYTELGSRIENPDFILNQPPYRDAGILLSGANFGCGSSREHAVWSLAEWGIRAIIAPSFGAIFYSNCVRNGILPVILDDERIATLADIVSANPAENRIAIDLEQQTVVAVDGGTDTFDITPADRRMLMEGLDPIAVTMQRDDEILAFQARDRLKRPWVYL
ncbi:MAG: 3-isopropylmalate dehydratase small subunit [Gammaproteobacteria bacterium]|nr:MAG: 3-isopropylmalate dehydratase small subunit [Gammaproteobacteria bacterium]